MIATWYVEAGKYDVMPIDGSGLARMIAEKPMVSTPRDRYTYRPDTQTIPFFAGPRVLNRPHSITADVEIPDGGAEGMLLSQGSAAGGFSFYLKDGTLRYVHNYVGRACTGWSPTRRCPLGDMSSGSSSSRPAHPTWHKARERQEDSSSTSTATWSPAPTPRPRPRWC